jgi:hypothetical protein
MDGSSAALIIIPIVVTISLAIWLIAVYHADSYHPTPTAGRPSPGPDRSRMASLDGPRLPDGEAGGDVTGIHGRHRLPRRNGFQPAGVMDRPGKDLTGASR